jgi:hypothetical protein
MDRFALRSSSMPEELPRGSRTVCNGESALANWLYRITIEASWATIDAAALSIGPRESADSREGDFTIMIAEYARVIE